MQEDTSKTIEANIFEALLTTRLIESRQSSNYHRCGRTDKGVSALSQVWMNLFLCEVLRRSFQRGLMASTFFLLHRDTMASFRPLIFFQVGLGKKSSNAINILF